MEASGSWEIKWCHTMQSVYHNCTHLSERIAKLAPDSLHLMLNTVTRALSSVCIRFTCTSGGACIVGQVTPSCILCNVQSHKCHVLLTWPNQPFCGWPFHLTHTVVEVILLAVISGFQVQATERPHVGHCPLSLMLAVSWLIQEEEG